MSVPTGVRSRLAQIGGAGFAVGATLAALALLGCGSEGAASGSTPEPQRRAPRATPPTVSAPAPVAAAPGALSGGSMWARGMTGGGGGGGLARDALERNRAERLAREGPQRPLSERHDELVRDGQEIARTLAARLPASARAAFEGPPPEGQSEDQAVRDRCTAMLEGNQQQLGARGDARGTTASAFVARCRTYPMEFWRCIDQGDAGREDPECRTQFARLDREVRTLRSDGRETAHPDQRLDTLVEEQWATEREAVAPETLSEETVERPPPVVLDPK